MIIIKDEKAFREALLTNDCLWAQVKDHLEQTVDARRPALFRIGQQPSVVVPVGQPVFGGARALS